MSISFSITQREKSKALALGSTMGLVGMNAYFLPVRKDDYVRAAYGIVRDNALDDIDNLNSAVIAQMKGDLSTTQKVFLDQMGIPYDVSAINNKIKSLKDSINDSTMVKKLKDAYSKSFDACRKSEVLRDAIESKAYRRVKCDNMRWGGFLGVVLGIAIGILRSSDRSSMN